MARQRFNFWIDDELRNGLRTVRERDGILDSEQIRRAVKDWLQKKGVSERARNSRSVMSPPPASRMMRRTPKSRSA